MPTLDHHTHPFTTPDQRHALPTNDQCHPVPRRPPPTNYECDFQRRHTSSDQFQPRRYHRRRIQSTQPDRSTNYDARRLHQPPLLRRRPATRTTTTSHAATNHSTSYYATTPLTQPPTTPTIRPPPPATNDYATNASLPPPATSHQLHDDATNYATNVSDVFMMIRTTSHQDVATNVHADATDATTFDAIHVRRHPRSQRDPTTTPPPYDASMRPATHVRRSTFDATQRPRTPIQSPPPMRPTIHASTLTLPPTTGHLAIHVPTRHHASDATDVATNDAATIRCIQRSMFRCYANRCYRCSDPATNATDVPIAIDASSATMFDARPRYDATDASQLRHHRSARPRSTLRHRRRSTPNAATDATDRATPPTPRRHRRHRRHALPTPPPMFDVSMLRRIRMFMMQPPSSDVESYDHVPLFMLRRTNSPPCSMYPCSSMFMCPPMRTDATMFHVSIIDATPPATTYATDASTFDQQRYRCSCSTSTPTSRSRSRATNAPTLPCYPTSPPNVATNVRRYQCRHASTYATDARHRCDQPPRSTPPPMRPHAPCSIDSSMRPDCSSSTMFRPTHPVYQPTTPPPPPRRPGRSSDPGRVQDLLIPPTSPPTLRMRPRYAATSQPPTRHPCYRSIQMRPSTYDATDDATTPHVPNQLSMQPPTPPATQSAADATMRPTINYATDATDVNRYDLSMLRHQTLSMRPRSRYPCTIDSPTTPPCSNRCSTSPPIHRCVQDVNDAATFDDASSPTTPPSCDHPTTPPLFMLRRHHYPATPHQPPTLRHAIHVSDAAT